MFLKVHKTFKVVILNSHNKYTVGTQITALIWQFFCAHDI